MLTTEELEKEEHPANFKKLLLQNPTEAFYEFLLMLLTYPTRLAIEEYVQCHPIATMVLLYYFRHFIQKDQFSYLAKCCCKTEGQSFGYQLL
ncbi:MAG TPA: hypothetical protein VIQ31_14835 [Phormidium sp.]